MLSLVSPRGERIESTSRATIKSAQQNQETRAAINVWLDTKPITVQCRVRCAPHTTDWISDVEYLFSVALVASGLREEPANVAFCRKCDMT